MFSLMTIIIQLSIVQKACFKLIEFHKTSAALGVQSQLMTPLGHWYCAISVLSLYWSDVGHWYSAIFFLSIYSSLEMEQTQQVAAHISTPMSVEESIEDLISHSLSFFYYPGSPSVLDWPENLYGYSKFNYFNNIYVRMYR